MKTVFPKWLRLAAALLFTVLPQLSNAADWKAIAKKDTFTATGERISKAIFENANDR